jgi:pimeloyl-ACP methyl ester carboxylesterase
MKVRGFVLFAVILQLASVSSALAFGKKAPRRTWPADYHSDSICLADRGYCIEVVHLDYVSPLPKVGAVALIPGFFQNGTDFDLLPEKDISFARYLMREKGLAIYFIHVRGIGNSDITSRYTLDDVSMDDIPAAIEFIAKREGEKIFVVGHSQGGNTLKAALSGLDHCVKGACFNPETAKTRQANVRGMMAIAANQSLSTRYHPDSSLPKLGALGWSIRGLTRTLLNYVWAKKLLTLFPGEKIFASSKALWEFLYSVERTPKDVRQAFYDRTLDGSSIGIINQYADAIKNGGIKSSSGELYVDGLKNISVPAAEVSFELDFFSPPQETLEDTVSKLNPATSRFFAFPDQRHEDFMVDPKLHAEFSEAFDWLLASSPR